MQAPSFCSDTSMTGLEEGAEGGWSEDTCKSCAGALELRRRGHRCGLLGVVITVVPKGVILANWVYLLRSRWELKLKNGDCGVIVFADHSFEHVHQLPVYKHCHSSRQLQNAPGLYMGRGGRNQAQVSTCNRSLTGPKEPGVYRGRILPSDYAFCLP